MKREDAKETSFERSAEGFESAGFTGGVGPDEAVVRSAQTENERNRGAYYSVY